MIATLNPIEFKDQIAKDYIELMIENKDSGIYCLEKELSFCQISEVIKAFKHFNGLFKKPEDWECMSETEQLITVWTWIHRAVNRNTEIFIRADENFEEKLKERCIAYIVEIDKRATR